MPNLPVLMTGKKENLSCKSLKKFNFNSFEINV
jgi:hypothetical protein